MSLIAPRGLTLESIPSYHEIGVSPATRSFVDSSLPPAMGGKIRRSEVVNPELTFGAGKQAGNSSPISGFLGRQARLEGEIIEFY